MATWPEWPLSLHPYVNRALHETFLLVASWLLKYSNCFRNQQATENPFLVASKFFGGANWVLKLFFGHQQLFFRSQESDKNIFWFPGAMFSRSQKVFLIVRKKTYYLFLIIRWSPAGDHLIIFTRIYVYLVALGDLQLAM